MEAGRTCISWYLTNLMILEHADTKKYLSADKRYAFGHPINGQLEVCARNQQTKSEQWIAQEGIYISSE